MSIPNARYLYADNGTTKTHVQLYFGLDEDGGMQWQNIKIDNTNDLYLEVMEKVNNGELTIAEA
jgi:hypothetical protein